MEDKADDRVEPVFREPPVAPDGDPARTAISAAPQAAPHESIFYADTSDRADLQNIGEAIAPLAELLALGEAETPFLAGVVGPSGSGKSFALRRLAESVEALAAAAGKTQPTPFLSRVLLVPIDAAATGPEPASALAAAAFAALERSRDGLNYAALADEAAHAGVDPHRAAITAAERHDEIVKRLDSQRTARDEVEAKRARLTEALLYDTPGSRIDAFIRSNRSTIDARLRRFDLADGDATSNYRDLVRDLDAAGAATRATLALRSLWAYGGQTRNLTLAVIAFALAFALSQLGGDPVLAAIRGLGSFAAPIADWLAAHSEWLSTAAKVLTLLGVLAVLLTIWRAFQFSALLFRGARLLNLDLRERRRELDASAARLNQRVAALTAEAEAAAQHAAAMARRAGGAKPAARAPGPAFTRGEEAATIAARSFFVELGRLMATASVPAPQRIVFVIDNLDGLAAGDALRLVAAANSMLGRGCAAVVACDPTSLASTTDSAEPARQRFEKLFQVILDARTLGVGDSGGFAASLIGAKPIASPPPRIDASQSRLLEPLAESEAALLTATAPLAATTPRGVKRFLNAYRLARLSDAPRPTVALMLAVRLAGGAAATAMRSALASGTTDLPDPAGPSALVDAIQAARAASHGAISLADAHAGWIAARRYAFTE